MGIFKEIWKLWNRKLEKSNVDSFDSIGWNVLKNDISLNEFNKRRHVFHERFKFKIFLPGLWICQKSLGKFLIKPEQIDKEPHNRIINAFNETFLQTIHEWCVVYRKLPISPNKRYNDPSSKALETMLSILNTGYTHDSAYRVFFDIMAINWAIKVGEMYPGKIDHMLYTVKTLNDLDFKAISAKSNEHMFFETSDGKLIAVKKGDAILIRNISDEIRATQEKERNSQIS